LKFFDASQVPTTHVYIQLYDYGRKTLTTPYKNRSREYDTKRFDSEEKIVVGSENVIATKIQWFDR
jgi:hypothetical protein